MRTNDYRKFRRITVIMLMLWALPGICTAQDEAVGKVVAVRGDAAAVDLEGAVHRLAVAAPVHLKDTLITGQTGRLQVLFNDNTIVSLGPGSRLTVAEYMWNPAAREGSMKTEVKEGVFRIMGGAIAKESPRNFTTETPVATIGIRGSMYAGRYEAGELMVVFQGGRGIEITTEAGSTAITRPGYGTYISDLGQPPAAPVKFDAADLAELNRALDPSYVDAPDDAEIFPDSAPAEQPEEAEPPDQPEDEEPPAATAISPRDDSESAEQIQAAGQLATATIQTSTVHDQEQTVSQTAVSSAAFTGKSMSVLYDLTDPSSANNACWYGDLSATSVNGRVDAVFRDQNGQGYSFAFGMPAYNPSATYAGAATGEFTRSLYLLGGERNLTVETMASSLGEFVVYAIPAGGVLDGADIYSYQDLGYMGVQSTSRPTSGVDMFSGVALAYITQGTDQRSNASGMTYLVNWTNGKVIGFLEETHAPPAYGEPDPVMFFFGDLTADGSASVTFMGGRYESATGNILWTGGSTTFGGFYGSQVQGVGGFASGQVYNIEDQSAAVGGWSAIAAGFREISPGVDQTAPTGTATLAGYAVGIAEDMANPGADRRVFLNTASSGFSLTINKTAGTLSGALTAADLLTGSDNSITGLEFGGGFGSACVLDQTFIAAAGDTEDNCIYHLGGGSTGLKDYGSYLVTEHPDRQFSTYATWGYWEIAYTEPGTGKQYHVHQPGSFWIAGEKTPAAVISNLVANSAVYTYTGGARGVRIAAGGTLSELTNGATSIAIDFNAGTASGTIAFSEQTLTLDTSAVNPASSSFSADIAGATTSAVQGTFYGPAANAIGGSFSAEISGDNYIGIFGGNR